jgi:excisionase family DNA binding protein
VSTRHGTEGHATKATITVEEAARLLGIGRGLAYAAVADGTLPAIRVGRRLLIPKAALLALLGVPTERDEHKQDEGSAREPTPVETTAAQDGDRGRDYPV